MDLSEKTLDRKMCCLCRIGHTLVFLYKFTSEKQKTDVLVELLVSDSQDVSLSDRITGSLMHDLASFTIVLCLRFKTIVLCPQSWAHHTVCETRRKVWSERWRKSLQVRHSKQTLSPRTNYSGTSSSAAGSSGEHTPGSNGSSLWRNCTQWCLWWEFSRL